MRSSSARLLALVAAVATLVLFAAMSQTEVRPYVVTAIDYHFHDAHPTLPIGPGRDLIVRNQGRNLHNVTIPALGFSRDVRPGGQVVIHSIGDRSTRDGASKSVGSVPYQQYGERESPKRAKGSTSNSPPPDSLSVERTSCTQPNMAS